MLNRIYFSFFLMTISIPLVMMGQDRKLPRAGAVVPFITYEAESKANQTNGQVIQMTDVESRNITPEMEASGRGYVNLEKQGGYLQLKSIGKANTIVIRYCIPDAPKGGGVNATLSLYVNNVKRQTVLLNSKYSWLYGSKDAKPGSTNLLKESAAADEKWQYGRQDVNGQSNDPMAGPPHVYWDESRFFIEGGVKKGDLLKLQKDAGDTAGFYRIDLADLEQVKKTEAPVAGTYISVTDFGATGNDATDDTKAIVACVAEAKKTGKTVWIPEGTFYQDQQITLDGVKVKGAGMWYTNLLATVEGENWAGNAGFKLQGNGTSVADLFMESIAHTRRSTGGKMFTGNPDNWEVKNVWLQHSLVGFWMTGATNGTISNCRVRNTYADGININDGAQNIQVLNNYVRGCGDDGIAVLSQQKKEKLTANIIVSKNTVTANWWGHNIDLAGGHDNLIDANYMADNAVSGCLTINLPSAYPMHPTTRSVIKNNLIERGGGDRHGMQKRGAVWIYAGSTTIDDVKIINNTILNSVFRAIHLTGNFEQNIRFERNTINSVTMDAIYIEPGVKGKGLFINNKITGVNSGFANIKNSSKTFTVE